MTNQPEIFPVSVIEHPFKYPVKDPRGTGAGAVGVPLAALPRGWRLTSLKGYLDEYRHRPARRQGVIRLQARSFPDYVNRYKNDDTTVLFVSRRLFWQRVTAVFDYHPIGPDQEQAGNATFRAWTVTRDAAALLKKMNLPVFYGEQP